VTNRDIDAEHRLVSNLAATLNRDILVQSTELETLKSRLQLRKLCNTFDIAPPPRCAHVGDHSRRHAGGRQQRGHPIFEAHMQKLIGSFRPKVNQLLIVGVEKN